MVPEPAQAGDVLAGRYRLDVLLDGHRAGQFWRAHDTVLHRPVAVRVIPADDERAERVVAAARSLGPLSDRRILRVLDASTAHGTCYVVLEWGQGESLDLLLAREGPLPPRQAAWLVAEVADCLADAHALDLTHGRLVPENVLVDDRGDVRLIGFGIDAALLGMPPGRRSSDVTDLAALLYAALTGKWPGVSRSRVPAAPEEQGRVLRPRRVRAGIPRVLDSLCDEVLNPLGQGRTRSPHDVETARGIADLLAEFVGDATGVRPAVGPLPPAAAPAAEPAAEPAGPPSTPEPAPTPAPPPLPAPAPLPETGSWAAAQPTPDVPTQAGMPVFHDDADDVEWLRARSERAAPPPPLEDVPAKPLFAPDPPEGEPVRRPRPGARPVDPSHYWPWESSSAGQHGPTTDTGSGTWPPGWGPVPDAVRPEDEDQDDPHVPGRSWIRLAMIVAVALLVLVAAVAAYQLGLGRPAGDPSPSEASERDTPATAEPTPLTDLVADDFDPQGSPPREENPDLAPAVLDGDEATAWSTVTYQQDFGPGGLKNGVGLVLDLGGTRGVRELVVTTVGGETELAAYVTGDRPTGVADLTPVGTAAGSGTLTISLEEATSGRYVTVWLTSIPAVDDGFRGSIGEVQVLG